MLDPVGGPVIDLRAAVESRAVVYFGLESDRLPLLTQMLGAAIVSDLVVVSAHFQENPIETVVLIDEFSAIGAGHVARLFARARGAGMSLLLATQELADLQAAGEGVREQVLGNLDALIAHRQNVPASAELVADIAGSRPGWVTTQGTEQGLLGHRVSGRGTRRREHERTVHPSDIMRLGVGQALVVTPPGCPRAVFARMCHPRGAGGELPAYVNGPSQSRPHVSGLHLRAVDSSRTATRADSPGRSSALPSIALRPDDDHPDQPISDGER
jgi:hypothetical protein